MQHIINRSNNPDEYKTKKSKNLNFTCCDCGDIFTTSVSEMVRRGHYRCTRCTKIHTGKERLTNGTIPFMVLNPEDYQAVRIKNLHAICTDCGNSYTTSYDRLRDGYGKCPSCIKLQRCTPNPSKYYVDMAKDYGAIDWPLAYTPKSILSFSCTVCGNTFSQRLNRYSHSTKMCKHCAGHQTRRTVSSVVNFLSEYNCKNPEDYTGAHNKNMIFPCTTCGVDVLTSYNLWNISDFKECKECQKHTTSKQNTKSISDLPGCIINPSEYKSVYTKNLLVPCNTCTKTITKSLDQILRTNCVCDNCVVHHSTGEQEVANFIQSLGLQINTNDRSIISPKELDIVIPKHNVAIEYNGEFYHSEYYKDKNYHSDKVKACSEKGYTLFMVWDTVWQTKKDIIKSMLKHKLGYTSTKIYARNTKVIEVSNLEAKEFYELNHLQGATTSSKNYALTINSNIVAMMSFKLENKTSNKYILTRFATILNTRIVGGASKLLKHFIKYNDVSIISSFSDKSYADGGLYEILGFTAIKLLPPDYKYFKNGVTYHKFGFRHNLMKTKLQNYDPNLSEKDNMLNNRYLRIYDAGKIKWELNITSNT